MRKQPKNSIIAKSETEANPGEEDWFSPLRQQMTRKQNEEWTNILASSSSFSFFLSYSSFLFQTANLRLNRHQSRNNRETRQSQKRKRKPHQKQMRRKQIEESTNERASSSSSSSSSFVFFLPPYFKRKICAWTNSKAETTEKIKNRKIGNGCQIRRGQLWFSWPRQKITRKQNEKKKRKKEDKIT